MKKQTVPCIYCEEDLYNAPLAICKRCMKLWNENWENYVPVNDEYIQLIKDCEAYIKQSMTGHTCGQEAGGDPELYASSNCFGCYPDTEQHYRSAAEMVIAWTEAWVQKNVMKNVLLKETANDRSENDGKD